MKILLQKAIQRSNVIINEKGAQRILHKRLQHKMNIYMVQGLDANACSNSSIPFSHVVCSVRCWEVVTSRMVTLPICYLWSSSLFFSHSLAYSWVKSWQEMAVRPKQLKKQFNVYFNSHILISGAVSLWRCFPFMFEEVCACIKWMKGFVTSSLCNI